MVTRYTFELEALFVAEMSKKGKNLIYSHGMDAILHSHFNKFHLYSTLKWSSNLT